MNWPRDSYHVLLFDGKIVRFSFFTAFRASDIRIMCASEILPEKTFAHSTDFITFISLDTNNQRVNRIIMLMKNES